MSIMCEKYANKKQGRCESTSNYRETRLADVCRYYCCVVFHSLTQVLRVSVQCF